MSFTHLSPAQVAAILDAKDQPHAELARLYGVTRGDIFYIRRRAGLHGPRRRIPCEEREEIKRKAETMRQEDVAKIHGIEQSTVSRIVREET